MSTPKKDRVHVMHQVWWEDLKPWIDQLWEDHHVLVGIAVSCAPSQTGLTWAVVVEGRKPNGPGEGEVKFRDWKDFNPYHTGGAESAALLLVTRALLALENEAALANAADLPLWA